MADRGERRAAPRHRAMVMAELHLEDGTSHPAMVRDASETGAAVLTRVPLGLGEAVLLEIFVALSSQHGVLAPSRVVRSDTMEKSDLWRYSVGLTFDDPLDCAPDLALIAAEQARALGE